jgi:hypothetical protein
MRTPNIGSVQYVPGIVPAELNALKPFLENEFLRIQYAIEALAMGHLDQINVMPAKPRTGDIRLFDGVNANPGFGKGIYAYYNNVWNKL